MHGRFSALSAGNGRLVAVRLKLEQTTKVKWYLHYRKADG